ncbi:hypothetical protein [Anabaena sp. CCY 0017]
MVLKVAVQVAGFKGDFSGFERSLLLAFLYVHLIRAGMRQTIYYYSL